MTLRVFLTVFEIVLFVVVLGYFLNRVAFQLNSICKSLAKVTFGVRAVETQCLVIGPATDRINGNLQAAASGLEDVIGRAERLVR